MNIAAKIFTIQGSMVEEVQNDQEPSSQHNNVVLSKHHLTFLQSRAEKYEKDLPKTLVSA